MNCRPALNFASLGAEGHSRSMTNDRTCAICKSVVDHAASLCPRGHSLDAPRKHSSMRELRQEIDLAFERASQDVAAAIGRMHRPRASAVPPAPAPPPPPALPSDPGPPLPPQPRATVWTDLERETMRSGRPNEGDPISAFAPAPRMDWGPKRLSFLERRGTLRRPSSASS